MPKLFHFLCQEIHASYCFYAAVWGIIIGIVLSFAAKITLFSSFLWILIAIHILLWTLHFSNRWTIIIAFLAGIIVANFRVVPEITSAEYFAKLSGATLTLSGKISDDPSTENGTTKLKLTNLQIHTSSEQTISIAGTIYVQLNTKVELERSDIITIEGKLGNSFGTHAATMYRPSLLNVERAATGDVFARLKNWFADLIRDYLPSPAVDLGLGYLMGLKSGLPDQLSDALSAVGMTHVIVASGAHLGILISAAKKLFGKISKFAGALFSMLLLCSFVLLVGFTPSMTRAGLVAALSLLVGYVGRKFTPLRLLSFVAAITLLLVPNNFLNLAWQLSFASFFGILVFAPRLQACLYGGKHPPWLASMLITSFSTSIICAPILIYNFGSISFLALVANLIILPTLPYAMLLVFLTGATSFLPWLAHLASSAAQVLLEFHINLIYFLSEKKMFIFELPASDARIYLIYLPVLIFLLFSAHKKLKKPLAESKNVLQ